MSQIRKEIHVFAEELEGVEQLLEGEDGAGKKKKMDGEIG